ncbi:MAG: hypothetical protein WBV94_08470 [Blastocatellia bacterium]
MRRRLFVLATIFTLVSGFMLTSLTSERVTASDKADLKPARSVSRQSPHEIKISLWGPTQETIDATKLRLPKHPAVRAYLKGTRFRLISFELLDKGKINGNIEPPDSYLAWFFDYTNNRALTATGRFDSPEVKVELTSVQPEPSDEEFQAAVDMLTKDAKAGAALRNQSVTVSPPMPPLVNGSAAAGKVDRTIAVALKYRDGSNPPEIVGVNMIRDTVIRYANNAPPASTSAITACGPSSANQSTTPRGTAGSFNVVISRAGTQIWSFIAVRPAASSGTRASGLEVQNVNYLGKRVLTRGHVPILNVQYDRNLCGPYRDWSYQEDQFVAVGSDVAPGIRMCTSPPQTILESGTDTGNFRGVAVWDDREKVQLVTEMQAGWYRYLMEWTFSDDGTISPRYGFGATDSGCVCNIHNHHAYWRLDFDIVTAANNFVTENTPVDNFKLTKEEMRPRLFGENQTWLIENLTAPNGESVLIVPGHHDSNFNKYSKGDLWFLVAKANEIDDGINCTQGCDTTIQITPFISGENINGADIVVWYAGHFMHDDAASAGTNLFGEHVVGPDIFLRHY